MILDSSNSSRADGNTIRQPSPCKRWCFTLNNYSDIEYDNLSSWCSSNSSSFCIGKEIGEEGTPHLQGYVNLNKKVRLTALKNINSRVHWEQCRGTEAENLIYCSKEGNYISNKYIPKPLKVLDHDKLFDWQKDIIEIIKKPIDDRKIYWFWEEKGNIGKSTFTKYLCHYYNGIPVEGKKNDILFCAATYDSDLYIFDFERTMEDYISYGAIEKIKNGCYMCSKYESKPIIRNSPNILIFANFEPNYEALSQDRWVVTNL